MTALSGSKCDEQQAANYTVTAALTEYLRSLDTGVLTSIGGEIGHNGGENSTPEELEAFLGNSPRPKSPLVRSNTPSGTCLTKKGGHN